MTHRDAPNRRHLTAIPFRGTLAERLVQSRGPDIAIYWLGQAGFVVDHCDCRIVIDPYLSDSLALKYRASAFPHQRMAPAPIQPDDLGKVDLVFCTHHHTDHMDGATLAPLARRLPEARFIVPLASIDVAADRIGVGMDRLIGVDAGQVIPLSPSLTVNALRAAHEALERDDEGHHKFLGYGLTLGGTRLFHSGDTIPFAGQEAEIRAFAPDLALLPVNGRSEELAAAGFAGNMTIAESIALAGAAGARAMIAHHYGMFAFNTAEPEEIDRLAKSAALTVRRAVFGVEFRLSLS